MSGYELKDYKNRNKVDSDQQLQVVVVEGGNRNTITGQPVDRYNLVYFILLIHGIGSLMPWNMFINAEKYFREYKLNNTSLESKSQELDGYRIYFLWYIGIASQFPSLIFCFINLFTAMGSGNLKSRVNLTLAVQGLIFAITIALAMIDSSGWPIYFFYATIISVIILNMAGGIYQNCVFGIGAKFPGSYTNAILVGSNLSGTFTSVVNLLSLWAAPRPEVAAVYYFITALIVIVVCIISYNLLEHTRFYKHFDRPDSHNHVEDSLNDLAHPALKDDDGVTANLKQTVDAMDPKTFNDEDCLGSIRTKINFKWMVLKKCWPQCFNVFLTFYVTLAMFPAILSDVKPIQNHLGDTYFTPFCCFFIFNFFAVIGNVMSSWTTWPGKNGLSVCVVLRILFIPFFLLCNVRPLERAWPTLIQSDILYTIGNALFALTSGYLSSLCMMFASSDLDPEEAPQAGMIAAFFLIFGIFTGISSSFIYTNLITIKF